jgi:hypothetical protein
MSVFIVIIAEIPSIYRKIEIKDEQLYGDDKLICNVMYVSKIIITTTEKIESL